MKQLAVALLVVVAVVFVVTRLLEDRYAWIGYVRAFAEAAMVGALADWFAVTALFRHPLGIPIPHTAIIPTRKDDIGRGLGEFVQQNFLTPDVLGEKIRAAQPATRAGTWLVDPANATRVGDLFGRLVAAGSEVLRDDDIQAILEHNLRDRARRIAAAPLVGRLLEGASGDGRLDVFVDAVLGKVGSVLVSNRTALRQAFAGESPWWVPMTIDNRVFERLFNGFVDLVGAMRADRSHALRVSLTSQLTDIVARLQSDPELVARGEQLKEELLAHPAVQPWIAGAWAKAKAEIVAQSADPASELRARLHTAVSEVGQRLANDPSLANKTDTWIERGVGSLVSQYGEELAGIISSTVERWDTAETVERIETQIGRDLQFIRINGTIVGGLAGVAIYVVGRLL